MNILLTESSGFSVRALEILQSLGHVQLEDLSNTALHKAVYKCDVLWVKLRNQISSQIIEAAPHLQWIVSPTTGLNHIDLNAAEKHGVRILCLRGEVEFLKEIRATAELTIGLMLALLRHIPAATQGVKTGEWNRNLYQGRELYEQNVGLVGFGRLGRIVADYLLTFGCRVRVCDPAVTDPKIPGIEFVPMETLLSTSRIVSLHASYEPGNEGFFNHSCFQRMPRGSWFINTARGELVDESAILAALQSGHLAGAALDVLTAETGLDLTTHPLVRFSRSNDHLIITPHIGGCTHESLERVEYFMAQKLKETLSAHQQIS